MALKELKNRLKELLFGESNDNRKLPGYIQVYRDQPPEEELAKQ